VQRTSTEAETWIVINPLAWNAESSIRCNFEFVSNVTDESELQSNPFKAKWVRNGLDFWHVLVKGRRHLHSDFYNSRTDVFCGLTINTHRYLLDRQFTIDTLRPNTFDGVKLLSAKRSRHILKQQDMWYEIWNLFYRTKSLYTVSLRPISIPQHNICEQKNGFWIVDSL
jgi:hypothetical protein